MHNRHPISSIFPVLLFAVLFGGRNSGWAQLPDTFSVPQQQGQSGIVPDDREGERSDLLEKAIFTLESYHSIAANLQHETHLMGECWQGKGVYLEQRSGLNPLVRLELEFPTTPQASRLVQVCDGRRFWTMRRLLDEVSVSRVDLDRLAEAAKTAAHQQRLETLMGLGGLPRLLRSIKAHFDFAKPESTRFQQWETWALRGPWKPAKLAKLLPDQKEAIEQGRPVDLDKLPRHLPDHVVLFLGKDDLFPYRIDYGRGSKDPPLASLQMSRVRINVALAPSEFTFQPPCNVEVEDHTDRVLPELKP